MKKFHKTPLATAMSVAVISTLANSAYAESNPFGMTELSQGYMQIAEASDMSMSKPKEEKPATETKTDAKADAKAGEMSCGGMMKGKEGMCGMMHGDGDKAKDNANNTGMKMPEGKCGDQCGENMKQCESAKAKEGACGAMMKGCGEGMQGCGEMMKGKEGSCAANKDDANKKPAATTAPATDKH